MKGMEVFWMVFSTIIFGVIIGAFGVTVPAMVFFGLEFTTSLGLWSTVVGMVVYRLIPLFKRKK